MFLAGCSQEPDDITLEKEVSLELSSRILACDYQGQVTQIAVSTNGTSWDYTSLEWVTITKVGEGALKIEVPANNTGSILSGEIKVTAMRGNGGAGNQAEEVIYVTQSYNPDVVEADYRDLSADGLANSYIANTEDYFKIQATVKGNGANDTEGGVATYIAKHGLEIKDAAYAQLLWESTADGDGTQSRQIIDGFPVYMEGYIHFKTGAVEGNAVIAICDAKGEILWSWHIWVTNSPIKHSPSPNGLQWMDRNLGAQNNTPNDINNRGLLYQWGRKDPFPNSVMSYEEAVAASEHTKNYQMGDGFGTWRYDDCYALPLSSAPGNIPFAVSNPMAFIQGAQGTTTTNWYTSPNNAADGLVSNLWGDRSETPKKTIFDPCPAGYTVPPTEAWTTDPNYLGEYPFEGDEYGKFWVAGSGDYFPFTGNIATGGKLQELGKVGRYITIHQQEKLPTSRAMVIYNTHDRLSQTNVARMLASAVRCVKEVN